MKCESVMDCKYEWILMEDAKGRSGYEMGYAVECINEERQVYLTYTTMKIGGNKLTGERTGLLEMACIRGRE